MSIQNNISSNHSQNSEFQTTPPKPPSNPIFNFKPPFPSQTPFNPQANLPQAIKNGSINSIIPSNYKRKQNLPRILPTHQVLRLGARGRKALLRVLRTSQSDKNVIKRK